MNIVTETRAIDLRRSLNNVKTKLPSNNSDLMDDLKDKENREPLQLVLDEENRAIIIQGASLLPRREKEFIYLRYLNNSDQKKAGRETREILGVSKASISGIKKKALNSLSFYLLQRGVA